VGLTGASLFVLKINWSNRTYCALAPNKPARQPG
jgi:hypothetical protein